MLAGGAADIMTLAMLKLDASQKLRDLGFKLLLQALLAPLVTCSLQVTCCLLHLYRAVWWVTCHSSVSRSPKTE